MNLRGDAHLTICFLQYLLLDFHQKVDASKKFQILSLPGGLTLKQDPSCPSDEIRIASLKVGIARLPNSRMYQTLMQWILFVQN